MAPALMTLEYISGLNQDDDMLPIPVKNYSPRGIYVCSSDAMEPPRPPWKTIPGEI